MKTELVTCEFVALTTQYPLLAKVGTKTSPTSGGRLVGIVRLRTKATEFSFLVIIIIVIKTSRSSFFQTTVYTVWHSGDDAANVCDEMFLRSTALDIFIKLPSF
jgi:hypothetical protein